MDNTIGIDLGTANTRTSVHRRYGFEAIPHDSQTVMPSYVAFTEGGRLVGQAAKSQASVDPSNVIFNALMFVGVRYHDPDLQRMIKLLPFTVIPDNSNLQESVWKRKSLFEVTFRNKRSTFTPVQILAMIIKRAKKDAEKHIGHPVLSAVITIPYWFKLSQRFAIKDAAYIAGIHICHILHAPTLAMVDLFTTKNIISDKSNTILYDIGAGYHSITLATSDKKNCKTLEIKAISGGYSCAGSEYDRRLMNHVIAPFQRETGCEAGLTGNSPAQSRLRSACEQAKHQLSSADEAVIEIENLCDGNDLRITVTRKEFELLTQDLISSLLQSIDRVLADTKLDKSQVDYLVLVGGSSQVPTVQRRLSEYFNGKTLIQCLDLEKTSARGAAFQASIIGGDKSSPKMAESLILDVTPWSLGIRTPGRASFPMVKRGTLTPLKRSKIVSTRADDQEDFLVTYYEGEGEQANQNVELGHVRVSIPPAPKGHAKLEVTFDIDDGLNIHTTVIDKSTGMGSSVKLDGHNEQSFDRIGKAHMATLIEHEVLMEHWDTIEEVRRRARIITKDLAHDIKVWVNSIPSKDRRRSTMTLEETTDSILHWLDKNRFAKFMDYQSRRRHLQNLKETAMMDQSPGKISKMRKSVFNDSGAGKPSPPIRPTAAQEVKHTIFTSNDSVTNVSQNAKFSPTHWQGIFQNSPNSFVPQIQIALSTSNDLDLASAACAASGRVNVTWQNPSSKGSEDETFLPLDGTKKRQLKKDTVSNPDYLFPRCNLLTSR